jgi:hypothetical protein
LKTIEKKREELVVGDVIVAKQGGATLTITAIQPGLGGANYPYLTLRGDSGVPREHDTSLDRESATYTVQVKEGAS